MSYRIEYQWAVFRVPEAVDLAAPRLIVAIELATTTCAKPARASGPAAGTFA
jgi:hypothetical protein